MLELYPPCHLLQYLQKAIKNSYHIEYLVIFANHFIFLQFFIGYLLLTGKYFENSFDYFLIMILILVDHHHNDEIKSIIIFN